MELDRVNQALLSILQREFPLVAEPFEEMGRKVGISGQEVISRIEHLKDAGVIRELGPVFDARRLGYHATLVAMKVNQEGLERAAQVLQEHQRVSHAYEREHEYNLWFTLAQPETESFELEIGQIAGAVSAEVAFHLPAIKLYKIGAYFGTNNGGKGEVAASGETGLPHTAVLSSEDRAVINGIQQGLPLVSRGPFSDMAGRLDMNEEEFLAQCRSLLERGIMRRYGAAINHCQAGFTANAMVCWAASGEEVDAAGSRLSAFPEISHCYERVTNAYWGYNLFAVIHGDDREKCRRIAGQVSAELDLRDPALLFSTRELKKTRVKYPV